MNKFNFKGKDYPVWQNQKGYACVVLPVNGSDKAFLLHKLVWEEANGPVPHGYELHHLDGNKANWTLDNLKAMDRKAHQEIHRQAGSTSISHKAGKKVKDMNPNASGSAA
jgi:hypothetical protein